MLKESEESFSPRAGRRKSDKPLPAYSLMSEKLRRSSSGSVQCSLFCGGQNCKYETPLHWGAEDKALKGLYSHWVTKDVLAMARPSTFLFKVYDIIGQFKSTGVCSVVNLQCPWEHAKCGPGLESSGFSYHPQDLMKEGVYYYNFGWSDYSVPSLDSLLDSVKVMDYALSLGKVAVHCHAGLGRTGVLIACHMIYSQRVSGNEAITHVRIKRPGSIQTRTQIETVQQFSLHLSKLWIFFPTPKLRAESGSKVKLHSDTSKLPITQASNQRLAHENSKKLTTGKLHNDRTFSDLANSRTSSARSNDLHSDRTELHSDTEHGNQDSVFEEVRTQRTEVNSDSTLAMRDASSECVRGVELLTFDDLLRNQTQVLHGQVQVALKYTPKVVHEVCRRIASRSRDLPSDVILHHSDTAPCQIKTALLDCLQVCCYDNQLEESIQSSIHAIKTEMNSSLNWTLLSSQCDLRVLLGLLAMFFSSLKSPFLAPKHISLLDTTHRLSCLPESRTPTITLVLATLKPLFIPRMYCHEPRCQRSVLTELSKQLASLFIQCDTACSLTDYMAILVEVLLAELQD